ncbi:RuBisCO large subunit C-terminal-like domain-containing protein [Ciceribacter selenitireducens]
MSAIKPVGLSTAELARLAHDFALGGMHFVKDDHGLVDQKTSPFEERLMACVEAVGEANAKSGGRTSFVPNIAGPAPSIIERAKRAQEAGAGAGMIALALTGYDVVRTLAADPDFLLPIVAHPAFAGANVVSPDCGFSHRTFFGTLHRLMGVDAVIYPNFGGRFGFTLEECLSIATACAADLGGPRAIAAAPGGGMTFARVPEMREAYGKDVIVPDRRRVAPGTEPGRCLPPPRRHRPGLTGIVKPDGNDRSRDLHLCLAIPFEALNSYRLTFTARGKSGHAASGVGRRYRLTTGCRT